MPPNASFGPLGVVADKRLEPAPAGIMYSAFGEKYVAEAARAARSSLRHNDVPHLIFAAGQIQDPPPGVTVVDFEPISSAPFVDRIANMRRSPFERTLYLDTDTFVVDEMVGVFELLDHYDLALAQAPAYRGLDDPEVPAAFPEFNCGVVAWRSSERVAAFLRSWEETYRAWLVEDVLAGPYGEEHPTRTGIGDQPAFRRCAWQHGMKVATLPAEYNLRLGMTTTVVDRVRLLHGHTSRYERLAVQYNRKIVPRTYPQERLARRFARQAYERLRR
ncbi:MAG TPA: hypothetical protein VHT25_08060 [Solirubrobacteraceae bacterium]|nr:hypothetical protein [Solirubrobacteraceae bacterium]